MLKIFHAISNRFSASPNSWLKFVASNGMARRKATKNRNVCGIHEDFKPLSNGASPSAAEFQQTAKPTMVLLLLALLPSCTTAIPAKTETPASAPAVTRVCTSETDTFCVEGEKDSGARFNMQGLEFARKQEYTQALEQFKKAVEMDNSNPEYHYNLGVTYSYLGKVEGEEASYMDVLAIEPDDPKANPALADTYFNLACLYALQGKKEMAFANLEKLFKVDSNALYHRVQTDEDLKSLRDDPRFKQLLAEKPSNTQAKQPEDKTTESSASP